MFEQPGTCFNGAQAFILQSDFNAKTAMQAVCKLPGAGGERLFGAIHIQRQANNDFIRLPLFKDFFDYVPVRRAVLGFDGCERACGAGNTLAHRNTDAFSTEIKG
ncbi:hypothetical protein D3C75_1008760 [compost metagenome]